MIEPLVYVGNVNDTSVRVVCPNCFGFATIPRSQIVSKDETTNETWRINTYVCKRCGRQHFLCSTKQQNEWQQNYKTTLFSPPYDLSYYSESSNKFVQVSSLTMYIDKEDKFTCVIYSDEDGILKTYRTERFECFEEAMGDYNARDDKVIIYGEICIHISAFRILKENIEERYPKIRLNYTLQRSIMDTVADLILSNEYMKNAFELFAQKYALSVYCGLNRYSALDTWIWFDSRQKEYLSDFDMTGRLKHLKNEEVVLSKDISSSGVTTQRVKTLHTYENDKAVSKFRKEYLVSFVAVLRDYINQNNYAVPQNAIAHIAESCDQSVAACIENKCMLEDNDALFTVFFTMKRAVRNVIVKEWISSYGPYFENLSSMSLSDCIISYLQIDTINQESDFYFSQFIHFLIGIGKLDAQDSFAKNYHEAAEIYFSQKEKLQSQQRMEQLKENLFSKERETAGIITIDDIDLMSGTEFERWIGGYFEKRGYKVTYTPTTGDQGIDVIAESGGKRIGIQAKCYSSTVGNSAVQEAVAGKQFYNLDKVMVITNSTFTSSAIQLAQANDVVLWSREILKTKL